MKPFSNHKKPFDLNECKNKTKLSNEIWRIKSLGHHPKVKWEIDKKCVLYITANKTLSTMLCLLLNKRNEVVSKCQHQLEYAPARYDIKD